jgi:pilus assembly protein FimV
MRRQLPRLLLTGALLSPATLYALGLGEIHTNSALNQPFSAEIELISPSPEELSTLKVGLASNDLFSRYGIDRPQFLSNFTFSVGRGSDGRPTIKVTSNRSVTEPFVTLLVEASWAQGRLVREYTVLLDPPVFMPSQPEAAPPVTTPRSGAQTEGRIERQQPAPTPTPTPTPAAPEATPTPLPAPSAESPAPAPSGEAALGGEYSVQRNDTLYKIASRINPGSRRVINQTMIALYRANPEAFRGNINRLRSGVILRVPELAEIEAIPTQEASQEVARQTQEWSGAQPTQSVEESNRLRLVTPEETPTAPAPAPATPSTKPEASGQAGTTAAPSNDRRLGVNNPELAGAQQNAAPAPAPEPEVQTPAPTEETPATTAEEPAATTAEPTPAPEQQPVKRPPPRQAPPQPQEPSLMERIGDYWWVLVLLGIVGVIALIANTIRKRREESGDSLDSLPPMSYEPAVERRGRADSFAMDDVEEPVAAEEEVEEPAPVTARREPTKARAPEPVEPAYNKVGDDTLSSETSVRLDQQDALAEADFHMAYGLYDQAADLVKIAIEREPDRRDLKLKLLEIYFVWGNKELFLDTARDLHATRNQAAAGEWDKILIMGKQIAPEDPMFKGESASPHVDLVDVNLEGGENRVDVDLFAEPEAAAEEPAGLDLEFASGEHKAANDGESDLDFLLDEEKTGVEDEPTRELDPLARTQETPTIESPMLDADSTKSRALSGNGTEQTSEISLDDLGLDVDQMEQSGAFEETTSLERDTGSTEIARPIADDEMTQLAPSLGSMDRTMEAPRVEKFDVESTGTIYIDQVDLSGGGDTVEQRRPDVDSTASLKRPSTLDVDLDDLGAVASNDTIRHERPEETEFSDVFDDKAAGEHRVDLDVGEPISHDDSSPTNKRDVNEMELSELEPVTMSEVGTKLDLARAYMDMGDPDGARSILEEVLQEGNPTQKQEANRLLESIR